MSFRTLLKLVRFPLVLTAAADSVTGALLFSEEAGHLQPHFLVHLGFLGVCSAFLYMGGMALNDAADADRDRALHPDRPIPSGEISAGGAALFGLLLLFAGIALVAWHGEIPLVIAAVIAFGILLYDYFLKRWSLSGALTMGLIRAGNLLMGIFSILDLPFTRYRGDPIPIFGYPAVLFGYVTILTLISTLEEREKGWTRAFRALWVLQMIVVASALLVSPPAGRLDLALHIAAAGVLIAALCGAGWNVVDRDSLMAYVRYAVFLIIALDVAFLICAGRPIQAICVLALLPVSFGMIRLYRRV